MSESNPNQGKESRWMRFKDDPTLEVEVLAESADGKHLWVRSKSSGFLLTVDADRYEEIVDPALIPKVGEIWVWHSAGESVRFSVLSVDLEKGTWVMILKTELSHIHNSDLEDRDERLETMDVYVRVLPERRMRKLADAPTPASDTTTTPDSESAQPDSEEEKPWYLVPGAPVRPKSPQGNWLAPGDPNDRYIYTFNTATEVFYVVMYYRDTGEYATMIPMSLNRLLERYEDDPMRDPRTQWEDHKGQKPPIRQH